jgi:hypothetical protein
MTAVKAIWKNGQILPAEPVDWPEGSELLVEPVPASDKIGLDESEWRDDAEALADWEAWIGTIEPLEYTDEERADLARYLEEFRRYNLEAVRKQMGLGDEK